MKIDQLTTANTFEEWLITTSSLIAVANNFTDNTNGGFLANSSIFIEGDDASLNVRTLANINLLYANTGNLANTSFENSNGTIQLDLIVGRNLVSNLVYATDVYAYGIVINPNAAFNQANAEFIHANSEFIKTNAAFNHANSGFIKTNSAFTQINSAFIHANSGFIQTNAAFNHANSGFIQANAAITHAQSGFTQANSGFIQANVAITHAQSGFTQANSGFIQSNAVITHAQSGFIQANSSYRHVNAAFNKANAAFIRANNSLDANNGGLVTGNVIIRSSGGVTIDITSGQDAIILKGTTTSPKQNVSVVPATLTDNVIVTVPNETFNVGFRNVLSAGEKTSSYILTTKDVGKFVPLNSGSSITIPNATFSEGDLITLFNSSSANISLSFPISIAWVAGINTDITSAKIPSKGVASIFFVDSTTCVCSGVIGYS